MNDTYISIAVIAIVFLVMYIGLMLLRAFRVKQENRMLKAYMDSIEAFCVEIQKRINAIRKYRHDLKGYITILESLIATQGCSEEVKRHIEEQNRKHTELSSALYGKDEFLSTIVQLKKEECVSKNIQADFCVEDGDYSGIKEIDKVCLLINLLDNAIEATERLSVNPLPVIKLHISSGDGKLKIHIENGLKKDERFSFITKKSDKYNHGLGVVIIQQVLEKYSGERKTVVDKANSVLIDEVTLKTKGKEVAA